MARKWQCSICKYPSLELRDFPTGGFCRKCAEEKGFLWLQGCPRQTRKQRMEEAVQSINERAARATALSKADIRKWCEEQREKDKANKKPF